MKASHFPSLEGTCHSAMGFSGSLSTNVIYVLIFNLISLNKTGLVLGCPDDLQPLPIGTLLPEQHSHHVGLTQNPSGNQWPGNSLILWPLLMSYPSLDKQCPCATCYHTSPAQVTTHPQKLYTSSNLSMRHMTENLDFEYKGFLS